MTLDLGGRWEVLRAWNLDVGTDIPALHLLCHSRLGPFHRPLAARELPSPGCLRKGHGYGRRLAAKMMMGLMGPQSFVRQAQKGAVCHTKSPEEPDQWVGLRWSILCSNHGSHMSWKVSANDRCMWAKWTAAPSMIDHRQWWVVGMRGETPGLNLSNRTGFDLYRNEH